MYAYTKSAVIEFTLGHVADKWCEVQTGVDSMLCLQTPGSSRWLMCSGLDGSGRLISPKTGVVLTTMFPPPPVVREGRALPLAASRGAFVLYALVNPMELWVYTVRTMPANRLQVWQGPQITALLTSAMIQGRRKVDSEAVITAIACGRHSGDQWPPLPEQDKKKSAARRGTDDTEDTEGEASEGAQGAAAQPTENKGTPKAKEEGDLKENAANDDEGEVDAGAGAEAPELTLEEEAAAAEAAAAAIELAKEVCLVGTSDGRILILSASSGELRAFFKASTNGVTDIRYDQRNPEILVVASSILDSNNALQIVLWDFATFEPLKVLNTAPGTVCWSLSLHEGSALLATGHHDGSVRVVLSVMSEDKKSPSPARRRTAWGADDATVQDGGGEGADNAGGAVGVDAGAGIERIGTGGAAVPAVDDAADVGRHAVEASGGGGATDSNPSIMSVPPSAAVLRSLEHQPTLEALAAEASTGLPGGNVGHAWHAEGKVLSVCADARVGRVLSSGQDGLLKVWDITGLLKINIGLAEAVPDERHDASSLTHVSCASFLNHHGDVVVAFHGNLYRIDRCHVVKEEEEGDGSSGRASPGSIVARAQAKAKAEDELLGIYEDNSSAQDDSDDPDEEPHSIIEDRNVQYEVIASDGGYVDPKPTDDIDAYLSPFMDMLAAAGLDSGFAGPVMSAWLDGGGGGLAVVDVDGDGDGKPRINADEFLGDADSVADTDVYYSEDEILDVDGLLDAGGEGGVELSAVTDALEQEQAQGFVANESFEPGFYFAPESPAGTPPRSPVTARIKRRREDDIEKALAKLKALKEQAEAEEKMRLETAATLKKEAADRKAIQDAEDAELAAKKELAQKKELEEAADKKEKYLKRQKDTAERNALLATEKATADAQAAAEQAIREREAIARAQKKRATPISKPKKGPSRREQKAAAAEKVAAASPQKPLPRGRPQPAGHAPQGPALDAGSDSDAEATPQFLTRKPPRANVKKLTPQNMQLPGTSTFKKRQPKADTPEPKQGLEANVVLTTTLGAAVGAAESRSADAAHPQLPPPDDFPDTSLAKMKKKKKKSKLDSLELELKPTQEQLDAETAARQAVLAVAIAQEAAEERAAAAEVAAIAAEVNKRTFRAKPAPANDGTPPRGTLYVQKTMPTRTIRTIKFAMRGIPGQRPQSAPRSFPAPQG